MEFEAVEHHYLAKFKNGREIVNQIYEDLTKNIQSKTKKDVMPVVLKLSK